MRFIDDQSYERLNIHKILNRIELQCSYGKDNLKKIKPYKRDEETLLIKEFKLIEDLKKCYLENEKLFFQIENKLQKLKNIKNLIEHFKSDYIFDETDFYELKIQGILFEELKSDLEFLPESLENFKLKSIKGLVDILDPNKDRIPTFYIYDYYSKKLAGIREKKKGIEKKIYDSTDSLVIEKLKEERLEAVVDEEREELHVRRKLMEELKDYISDFRKNIEIIGRFDLILGKVKFAIKYGGCFPEISKNGSLIGEGLINLELSEILKEKGKKIVPIDIELVQGSNLITGANMGGKSIALKTVAENLLIFHYGIFPIGKRVLFPLVDFLFFISDDMQDLSKGLSTFGAEIIKLKEVSIFLKQGKGVLFFDEFARGTNPEEGKRFAKSLLKYLNSQESISLITTHFDGVAQNGINHYQVKGLKNVDFEKLKLTMDLKRNSLDVLQEFMDYRLEKTNEYEVPKYAMNIGILLGMNSEFLKILQEEYREE